MASSTYTSSSSESTVAALQKTLSQEEVIALAAGHGVVKRSRRFSVSRCLSAILTTFGSGREVSVASIHRGYNATAESAIDYKALYEKLSSNEFCSFMRALVEKALNGLWLPVMTPEKEAWHDLLDDIVLQDGTSFALRDALEELFPGRFSTTSPAAVEVHLTFSAFGRSFYEIAITPDTEAEKHYRPEPWTLKRKLIIADRGYEEHSYFREIQEAGGYYLIRGKANGRPRVLEARDSRGRRIKKLEGKVLSRKKLPRHDVDLLVSFTDQKGEEVLRERMVLLYRDGERRKKEYQRLHTNLDRKTFPLRTIDRLYRFRWQIELLIKELKSFSGLKKVNTTKETIVEALIWASILVVVLRHYVVNKAQLATEKPLSTHKAASASVNYFASLVSHTIFSTAEKIIHFLKWLFPYLIKNTVRSNLKRDRTKGSLKLPLKLAQNA